MCACVYVCMCVCVFLLQVELKITGIGALQAEKFVRLCGGGVGCMSLSKSKVSFVSLLLCGIGI